MKAELVIAAKICQDVNSNKKAKAWRNSTTVMSLIENTGGGINFYFATKISVANYKAPIAPTLNKFHTPTPPPQISSNPQRPLPVSIHDLSGDTPHARDHHD